MKTAQLFFACTLAFFYFETNAQVQNFSYTDCNGNTETVYSIIGQGKPLIVASKGFDCSICMNQAPAMQTFAAQNPNVRIWGAMNYRYSSSMPTCTQVSSWKNSYSWNDIFMFLDLTDEWQGVGYPTHYVISPVDSTIIYTGSSFSTATNVANSVILACNAPAVSVTTSDALCNGESGSATLSVSGGNPPYAYVWSSGESVAAITKLAGVYSVTVTDYSGCASIESVTIQHPALLETSLDATDSDINCTGSATAAASGGTTPYTYTWSNGLTSEIINNLCAGNYSVTVFDANNCFKSDSLAVAALTGINDAPDDFAVSIFPNPAQDEIRLNISGQLAGKNLNAEVYNKLGEMVLTTGIIHSETKININALVSGVYLLTVRSEGIDKTLKFVKE
ncbi:MAG: T9SS type A sorting domain-containing protein [Chitinophagales bacterium]|nr:T9SS type A sorting domain-containing protein [Chitinophagales bacterium]